jgi:prepilin-type N-terminal cleavage/methylation domain-containing protein
MKKARGSPKRERVRFGGPRNINGFSIVELLIALAITALLLAAVAVAFNASITNYCENEDIFRAVNNARQALYRITTQLRTATAVDPCSPVNECTFLTAGGEDITYRYNSADGKLYLITNSDGQQYLLCDNVTAMTFNKNTRTIDSFTFVASVQISMTVAIDDTERTVSGAVVIRRNLN